METLYENAIRVAKAAPYIPYFGISKKLRPKMKIPLDKLM